MMTKKENDEAMDKFIEIMYWKPTACPICRGKVIKAGGLSGHARCLGEDKNCPFHDWVDKKYWDILQRIRDTNEKLLETLNFNFNVDWGEKVVNISIHRTIVNEINKQAYEVYKALNPNQKNESESESEKDDPYVDPGDAPGLPEPPKEGRYWGWIYGNNLKIRGYYEGNYGVPNREPWFTDVKGCMWSEYDVRFEPDDPIGAKVLLEKITE